MIERSGDFKRMVLGLPHSAGDYASVAFTAELAEQLGLELVGLFIEDETLADVAALSCAREFRFLGEGWHRIDIAQWQTGANRAAANARRLFEDAAKALHVGTQFNLARGPVGDVIDSQSTADDILVVIEPKNPAERVTHQFSQFMDVALKAPASVLLVPSLIRRRRGPIIAVVGSEHDPSFGAALRVATAVKEKLVVVSPAAIDDRQFSKLAEERGVVFDRQVTPAGAAELSVVLPRFQERLLVLSRGDSGNLQPRQLAFSRGVPVLMIESGSN